MSGDQFREVDLDLLADYVGGALDGTPDAAEIVRLISEDPAWADAHTALTSGVDAVRASLTSWAAVPAPMPPDVVDRLTATLAEAAGTGSVPTPAGSATPAVPALTGEASATHRSRRQLSAVPAQAGAPRRPEHARTRGRRRWSRLAGPVAVAAAVVGFAGFAVTRMLDLDGGGDTAATTAGSRGESAADASVPSSGPPRALVEPSAERMLASGTDYSPATLPSAVLSAGKRATATTQGSSPDEPAAAGNKGSEGAPLATSGLDRLADPTALARCLDAVAAAHNEGPVAVDLVDYASFQGTASLVVVFTDRAGARWAWVAGPDCGTSSAGADTKYQTRVG